MKFKKSTFQGMTLTELLVTLVVGTLFLGIVLSSWYFTYRNWSIERMRTRLRIDLAVVMERVKEEMRLSSLSYTSFYPSDALEYTAISFPMAKVDTNDSRFLDLNTNNYIKWGKSVIYHIFENPQDSGNYELRRTEFTNNYAYLTDETDRNKQLSDLVQYGEVQASTPNRVNADTDTILKSIDSFTIKFQAQLFDGYSSTIQRSDKVEFGNIKIDYGEDGYHDFRFEVVGKNADSSDRKFGIDVFSITPSGCPREAEFYYPLSSPHSDSGGTPSEGDWSECSGNHYLEYSSGNIGDYINLHIYYDLWRESDFDGSTNKENTILTGDDLYIKLRDLEEGNEVNWEAGIQAGGVTIEDYNDALSDITVRNVISGANLDLDGDLVRVKFDAHSDDSNPGTDLSFTITAAYIDERESVLNPVNDGAVDDEDAMDPAVLSPPGSETRIQLYFLRDPITKVISNSYSGTEEIAWGGIIPEGESRYSNWAIFPIDETKDYFVTFHI
ncbi:MAG: hypothetical protein KAU58_04790, partial [Candidatus Omnitrophica bacterium]|nr:hypothetical protein [Candidatus Omnitrophota bacterium]